MAEWREAEKKKASWAATRENQIAKKAPDLRRRESRSASSLWVALLPADRAEFQSADFNSLVDGTHCSAIREEAERRLGEVEVSRRELLARVEAAEDELRALTAELKEEKGAHTLARSEVRAVEARLAEAYSTIAVLQHEARGTQLKVEQLEAREKRALEQAQHAVQLFRESEEFRELLEEEAVDGLIRGFEDFRRQLRRLCPEFNLSMLQPGGGIDEDEGGLEGPVEAEDEAAEEAAREASAEGAPEGVPDAAPEAAGDVLTETSVTAAGQAEEPGEAPAENPEVVIVDDLEAGAKATTTP
ncbi:ribonuclease Y-like [Phoenix dactylifera]|uniref:Ribonuclease Y-like n=1 Tax=Phoenix dactylifera TaxID=42345 RepID=A0A8B9ASY5_PHODC|nr:ribonuclease Y-like [Phoenix dactylifera]